MQNKTYFFDGAFGTYYTALTSKTEACEYANLYDSEAVLNIHKEYIDAGVDAIKTNTYGANILLSSDSEIILNIIKKGFSIAKKAAEGTNVSIFADIGYINFNIEDNIHFNIENEYIKTAKAFIECGAKKFLFETLAEYEVILPVIEYIKKSDRNTFIMVSFAVSQDGYTNKGLYYKDLISQASNNSLIDVVGLNCICGPGHLYNLIKELQIDLLNIKFSAMPNSGYPSTINGRVVFQDNAEYFAGKLNEIYKLNVNILGGCCGTTPLHIKQSIDKIKNEKALKYTFDFAEPIIKENCINNNLFKEKLKSEEKIIAVELDPPLDTDCEYIISAAQLLKAHRVDIITIADSPLARTRADSIAIAAKIKREIGIDVMPHLSCRDKNQIGIKSTVLGANIENINNILIITGDPVAQTDRINGKSKGVFSFNSFSLIAYIKSLNKEIFQKSPFNIAGALNVNAVNFDIELKRAETKILNGASFLLTQPIYTEQAIKNLRIAKENLNCKLIAGILPFASYKNALFLNNEVTGISIPDELINSLQDKDQQQIIQISVNFSINIIEKVNEICNGYYLMTPLRRTELICALVDKIKEIIK
ncbi:MAG: cobalamin-dependent methionine synthase [Clostridia bacterium]|nr:cobalamin-dependent methionine synthase [Clostridia bacterium]